jgi:hypothetical protein
MNAQAAVLMRTLFVVAFGIVGAFLGVLLGMVVWGIVFPACPPHPRSEVCDAPAMLATLANLLTGLPVGAVAGAVVGKRIAGRLTYRCS